MGLIFFKWFAAIAILVISLGAGFASIRFVTRNQRWLSIGDALANGVFLGVGLFHLLPHAFSGFERLNLTPTYLYVGVLTATSYIALMLIERASKHSHDRISSYKDAWILIGILSIHALIAGITLGITESLSIVSIMFIAILAHKGFEMFALVVNIHRGLSNRRLVMFIFVCFALITPVGILLGALSDSLLAVHLTNILTASFNAIAAGTFLYIGSAHTQHQHYSVKPIDSYQRYAQVLATLLGVAVMAILSIWV